MNWEDARPRWVSEVAAEALGVFTYVYCGVGATAALYMSIASKEGPGFGSLFTVGWAYAIGIIIAILIAGPVSGGHLSPVSFEMDNSDREFRSSLQITDYV